MRSIVLTFGLIILSCLILFEAAKFSLIKHTLPIELLVGIFAALFLVIGILIAGKRGTVAAKEEPREPAPLPTVSGIDQQKIEELGITRREYEVLLEITLGLSNQEIADKLFVTESTIKTHISSLLVKLDAKRRTDAIRVAKDLKIIN
ncbi:MAG: response regulator transcription factor [Bacteroidia bacterium]